MTGAVRTGAVRQFRASSFAWLACVACLAVPARVSAHTATLSVLSLEERAPGEFSVRWEKTQGIADPNAAYDLLRPVFPEHCRFSPPRLACGERGLTGRVGFEGLADLGTAGSLKIRWRNGDERVLSLTGSQPSVRIAEGRPVTSVWSGLPGFVWVGVLHIWLGFDHLLFVLGLCWLVGSWRALVRTITAFTAAHSLTLGAATLGFTAVPAAPVEAVIALSIAFVAVEIAGEARSGRPSLTRQRPWLVAFAFGLLHGFGFANALAELELSRAQLPVALLGFNVGVELGQLAFIAGLLALTPLWRRSMMASRGRVATFGYYALGTLAMAWFIERVVAFFPRA